MSELRERARQAIGRYTPGVSQILHDLCEENERLERSLLIVIDSAHDVMNGGLQDRLKDAIRIAHITLGEKP